MIPKPAFHAPMFRPPVSDVRILFSSLRLPTGVIGLAGEKNHSTDTRYEADVTVSGGITGRFKGSVYPDNMTVKGRLANGTYDIYLGFHQMVGIPAAKDLAVRTNHFRAVLIINAGRPLPVVSKLVSKTTSDALHIHNGWAHWTAEKPMSDGCLLIAPGHWHAFLTPFLNAFPKVADWTTHGANFGRKIGTVTVSVGTMVDSPNRGGVMYA